MVDPSLVAVAVPCNLAGKPGELECSLGHLAHRVWWQKLQLLVSTCRFPYQAWCVLSPAIERGFSDFRYDFVCDFLANEV